jgi:ubiquitin-conjugating enzyme E2 W
MASTNINQHLATHTIHPCKTFTTITMILLQRERLGLASLFLLVVTARCASSRSLPWGVVTRGTTNTCSLAMEQHIGRGGASNDNIVEDYSQSEKPKKKKKKRSKSAPSGKSTDPKKKRSKSSSPDDMTAAAAKASTKSTTTKSKHKTNAKQKNKLNNIHLQKDLKSSSPNYRIQRELKAFVKDPPPHLRVRVGKNLRIWIVTMQGAPNTIYEGETFQLRIQFPPKYPTVPPSVYFLPPNIPQHEHVYTNGDICLSLLGKDWAPTMTAQSIAVSILSILSSARSKSLPMDNAQHALNRPGKYQKDWIYHDDNC